MSPAFFHWDGRFEQSQHNRAQSKMNAAKGFTIIEVVVIVLILGIVSAFAMARILRGDTLDSAVVSDQLIAMTRLAQQKAIGRSDVQLRIEPEGGNLVMTLNDISGVLETSTVAVAGVSVYADVNQQSSCSNPPLAGLISDGSPMILNFDRLGDLHSGGVVTPVDVETGVRLCMSPDTSLSVCISKAGFAYRGDCLP